MGKEILYCDRCGKRLISDDFTRGRAHTILSRSYCNSCIPHRLDDAPRKATTRRIAARPPGPVPVPPKSRGPLVAALSVGAVAIFALALAVGFSGTAPAPSAPPVPDKSAPAIQAIKAAREFARANPSNLAGQVTLWQQAVNASPGTPQFEEAKAELARTIERRDQVASGELNELSSKLRPLIDSEQFQAATALIDEAAKRYEGPAGKAAAAEKSRDVMRQASARAVEIKEQAAAARRRGAEEEVQTLRTRLEKWGYPEYVVQFDRAVEQAGPPDLRPIFNGKDLEGWKATEGTWRVEDGILVGSNPDRQKSSFIRTEKSYKDYEFSAKMTAPIRAYVELHLPSGVVVCSVDPGRWVDVKVVHRGDQIEALVDGSKPKVVRRGNKTEGTIGIFLGANSTLRVKDLRLRKF